MTVFADDMTAAYWLAERHAERSPRCTVSTATRSAARWRSTVEGGRAQRARDPAAGLVQQAAATTEKPARRWLADAAAAGRPFYTHVSELAAERRLHADASAARQRAAIAVLGARVPERTASPVVCEGARAVRAEPAAAIRAAHARGAHARARWTLTRPLKAILRAAVAVRRARISDVDARVAVVPIGDRRVDARHDVGRGVGDDDVARCVDDRRVRHVRDLAARDEHRNRDPPPPHASILHQCWYQSLRERGSIQLPVSRIATSNSVPRTRPSG